MSGSASLTSGVAGRYATALFEIAREASAIERVGADLATVEAALAESADLRGMIQSPVFTREEQGRAVAALSTAMQIGPEVANTLGLLAQNRRLFVLPGIISQVKALIAADKGEVTAEVTAARPLTPAQTDALAAALRQSIGKDVMLDVTVDESLIGGLVVKVGSHMVDSSIRSKLAHLQNIMKEVG